MKLILPKTFVPPEHIYAPIFYIAGPIRGGANWQRQMCIELCRHIPDLFAVVPCRWKTGDDLYEHRVEGYEDHFDRQTSWEHYYLQFTADESAKHQGCLIFYLPLESKDQPRMDGNPYGRDTYGELGAWRVHLKHHRSIGLVMGGHPNFPGLDVIRHNFKLDLTPRDDYPFYPSLEETAKAAADWVKK